MMKIELNQSVLRGGQRLSHATVTQVAAVVGRMLKQKGECYVSVAFVSPVAIRRANRLYRGNDRVTDVLSFSLSADTGELLVCFDQAKKQARAMKHSVRNEIIFLFVHGLLHLFGHDHEKEDEAKKMFALQTKILEHLQINPTLTYD